MVEILVRGIQVDLILALDGTKPFQCVQSVIRKLPFGRFSGIANCRNLREHGELTIYPNKLHFYSFVPKFLIGESFNSAEHLSAELTPIKVCRCHQINRHVHIRIVFFFFFNKINASFLQTPADQVNQNLMLEMSKIQEMLLSMNEGLREVTKQVRELREEKDKTQDPE